MEDENQSLTHTTITIRGDQKKWLQNSEANISGLVRDIIDEAIQRDEIDSANILEEILTERRLLESRCETLERLFRD